MRPAPSRSLFAGAAAALLVAGCTSADPDSAQSDSARPPGWSPTPTRVSPAPVRPTTPARPGPADPGVACGGYPFNPRKVRPLDSGGAPYTGRHLHPVRLIIMSTDGKGRDTVPGDTELPEAWDASSYNNNANAPGPNTEELLVCQERDRTYRSRQVDTCVYTGDGETTRSTMFSARYRYRVFEVTTAKPVSTFTLVGTVTTCPALVGGMSGEVQEPRYYGIVLDDDLAARLRPFVTGSARR